MLRCSSVSDNEAYPEFCYFASKRDDIFKNFKQNPIYNQILEHVSPELGKDYLIAALKNTEFNFEPDKWNIFFQNDTVGNPRLATYNFGNNSITCSPSTLRYIKVLSDIVSLFDISKIKTVAEVGIGYAGQCRILINAWNILEYYLVDLPEVLSLAERFLYEVKPEIEEGVRYIDGTHLYNKITADFFISNYAFSELTKSAQDVYLEKIILNAKKGYITWNGSAMQKAFGIRNYTAEEILSIIPGSMSIPEVPLTAPENCIIVWGNK